MNRFQTLEEEDQSNVWLYDYINIGQYHFQRFILSGNVYMVEDEAEYDELIPVYKHIGNAESDTDFIICVDKFINMLIEELKNEPRKIEVNRHSCY